MIFSLLKEHIITEDDPFRIVFSFCSVVITAALWYAVLQLEKVPGLKNGETYETY